MGYNTEFTGFFTLTPPLTEAHRLYLESFAYTRRMQRQEALTARRPDPRRLAVGLPVGPEGAYFVGDDPAHNDLFEAADVLGINTPPDGQPGLWCQWVPTTDGRHLVWDEGEKFYDYVPWLRYLLENFLIRWGYTLEGRVTWQGEERGDKGVISVTANSVTVTQSRGARR